MTALFDHERIKAAVLAYLVGPNPDTGEVYETEGWRIEVEDVPAEVDDETGEEWIPATVRVTAYDLGHHSNVLNVRMDATCYEVEGLE